MRLQEEYLKRHNLNCDPIQYVTKGSLLMWTGNNYALLTIKWVEEDSHPGKFHVDYLEPVHNGYSQGVFFTPVTKTIVLEWENYVKHFEDWRKQGIEVVVGHKQIALACWEIFLFCCDRLIKEILRYDLEKVIYRSINSECDVDKRYDAFNEAVNLLNIEQPSLIKMLYRSVFPSLKEYCYWLANSKN